MMKIELVYATPIEQDIIELEVQENATVYDALVLSALADRYAEIVIGETPVGIYGERVRYETILQEGDRVEIYRPLTVDPMEARRLRAQSQAKKKKK